MSLLMVGLKKRKRILYRSLQVEKYWQYFSMSVGQIKAMLSQCLVSKRTRYRVSWCRTVDSYMLEVISVKHWQSNNIDRSEVSCSPSRKWEFLTDNQEVKCWAVGNCLRVVGLACSTATQLTHSVSQRRSPGQQRYHLDRNSFLLWCLSEDS